MVAAPPHWLHTATSAVPQTLSRPPSIRLLQLHQSLLQVGSACSHYLPLCLFIIASVITLTRPDNVPPQKKKNESAFGYLHTTEDSGAHTHTPIQHTYPNTMWPVPTVGDTPHPRHRLTEFAKQCDVDCDAELKSQLKSSGGAFMSLCSVVYVSVDHRLDNVLLSFVMTAYIKGGSPPPPSPPGGRITCSCRC